MKNKKGFISMTLVYTFLIVFMFLMLAVLRTYTEKDKFLEAINKQIDRDIGTNKKSSTTLISRMLDDNSIQSINEIYLFNIANEENGNGNGLYYIDNKEITDEDNDEDSADIYIYRGSVENNHVVINDICFRIIRTNENGSIIIRYNGEYKNGTCPTVTDAKNGKVISIGKASYSEESVNYVELVNGKIPHASESNNQSNVIRMLNNWYKENLLNSSVSKYIETDVIYCNNKKVSKQEGQIKYYGATDLNPKYKSATNRNKYDLEAVSNKVTLKCINEEDRFNAKENTLLYPVGLIRAEEVVLAGGYQTTDTEEYEGGERGIENESYYINTGSGYWTMSPIANSPANVSYVDSKGTLRQGSISSNFEVVPVIAIKQNAKVEKGNGNYNNPYIVK